MLFKSVTISCFILISGFHIAFAQKKDYQINAVAFYNLENLFDTLNDPGKIDEEFTPSGSYHYTAAIYNQKLHNMATVLSQIATERVADGPSLVGVAEIENARVLQDLLAQPELRDRKWKYVHFESPDVRGIDVGMLYNPKYFKVLQAASLPIDITENGQKEYTRDILYVIGLLCGDTVHVMVGHWPSRRGGESASKWKRDKAASVCRTKADQIRKQNPDARIIVMGDLNDDPISPSVAVTLGGTDKETAVKQNAFFNPWIAYYKKGIGTLGYNDSWNLFDQIMLSAGFLKDNKEGWQFYKAEIFNRSYLRSQFGQYKGYPHRSFSGSTWINGYSDHFPTYIYLVKQVSDKSS
jgi:hypothetical protein